MRIIIIIKININLNMIKSVIIIIVILIFLILYNHYLCAYSKGEDVYFKLSLKNDINKKFLPIQLGCYKIKCNSNEEFIEIMKKMKIRIENFIKKNWNDYDEKIIWEIKDKNELFKINIYKIKVMVFCYHIESKMIYAILNHGVVGGGDYLLLGTEIFNGETNSLIKYDNKFNLMKSILNYCCSLRCSIVFFELLFKKSMKRYLYDRIIYSKINLEEIRNTGIKLKYSLIYRILTNIMNSGTTKKSIKCWLPIAFEKYENCPYNNIGLLLFTFTKGMSEKELEQEIENNKFTCMGTYNFLINSYSISTTHSYYIETILKKNIDVCITLGNIINNEVKVDLGTFGMYYKMNMYNPPFPYYVGGISMDNIANITYSVTDVECDIEKLKNITKGEEVTHKYIYELNTK